MEPKTYPTREAIRQSFVDLRAKLALYQVVPLHVIQGYPIGRRDRGLCKLEVEYKPGKGFRRIKTTTDRSKLWCNPKKSVWDGFPNYVIVGDLAPGRTAGWLQITPQRVAIILPNADSILLLVSPSPWGKPRREPQTIVWTKRTITFGTEPEKVTREEDIQPADPVELCDAYDAWIECFGAFRREYEERCNPIVNQREMVTA